MTTMTTTTTKVSPGSSPCSIPATTRRLRRLRTCRIPSRKTRTFRTPRTRRFWKSCLLFCATRSVWRAGAAPPSRRRAPSGPRDDARWTKKALFRRRIRRWRAERALWRLFAPPSTRRRRTTTRTRVTYARSRRRRGPRGTAARPYRRRFPRRCCFRRPVRSRRRTERYPKRKRNPPSSLVSRAGFETRTGHARRSSGTTRFVYCETRCSPFGAPSRRATTRAR